MEKQNIAKCLEKLWPVGLYWLVLMIGDFLVARATFWVSGYSVAIPLTMGYFFGQFCLAAILGGLLGRTWVSGWLIGVVLAAIGMAVAMMGFLATTSQDPREQLAILTFAPLLMLAACGPFMAMRGLRGWSLTLGKDTAIVKQRAGVEDLLLLSVIVACSFSLTRIVAEFSPGFSESNQGLIIPAFYFGFSLFFAVPTAWITFRARNWGQRLLCWAGIALAVIVVCLAMDWFMSPGGRSTLWSTLKGASIGVGSCAVTVAMGAWAMLASGFKLTHFAKEPALDEADEAETLALQRSAQRQARWLTGGVALLALLASGWMSLADYRRIKLLEAAQAWEKQPANLGSSIAIKEDNIVALAVAPDTTDASFSRYTNLGDLERLSLANSRITDGIAASVLEFPKLQSLDLSGTDFSDAGLEQLRECPSLQKLSVAKTRVSFQKALETAKAMDIPQLDVSELGVDDDQLPDALDDCSVKALALRGNPITDKGLAKLMKLQHKFFKLDLSNTAIDGSGLLSVPCPGHLILDGTQITDANLIAILKANPGIMVSLKNTAITARVLKVAVNMQASLKLGGGRITDGDLARLGPGSLNHLGLNGPEFTGVGLGQARVKVQYVDLSHSSLTDAAFAKLRRLGDSYITGLNLSHTSVTDAIMPILQKIPCYELDLRHTKITAQGLMNAQLSCGRILLEHNQFTPTELNSLRQNHQVVIDEDSNSWQGWEDW